MPIWLRKFIISQIVEFRKKEQKEYEKISRGDNSTSTNIGEPIPPHMKKILKDE